MNAQVCKRRLGLLLFTWSWIPWLLLPLLPFVSEMEAKEMAATSVMLIASAEISFALSLLLLGRDFYHAVKMRLAIMRNRMRGG